MSLYIEWDVGFLDNPRVSQLRRFGKDVRGLRDLYLLMSCYCKRALTDGFVPDEEIPVMVMPDSARIGHRDAQRLAEVGLIERAPGDDGWMIPGYLQRNKTRAQVLADSADKSQASSQKGSFGNHKRWHLGRGLTVDGCRWCVTTSDPRATDSLASSDRPAIANYRSETETETETPHSDGSVSKYPTPVSREQNQIDDRNYETRTQ